MAKPIGIIGPTKLELTEELKKVCKDVSGILVKKKYSVLLNPTLGSTVEFFGKEFKNQDGKVEGIVFDDNTGGYPLQNRGICDSFLHCITWENQPRDLVRNSGHLVVLGFSIGTTWEICMTKFYWGDKQGKVFIMKETMKERLPKYMEELLPIIYVTSEELGGYL
ncbi:MAG: hypothetical protein V1906_03765 [Candidatus Woesearchaeota archaeon]